MTDTFENAWKADEHDRVASAIRDLFTRDLLKARLQRMDEVGLPEYERSLKQIPREKKKVSLTKLIKSILP